MRKITALSSHGIKRGTLFELLFLSGSLCMLLFGGKNLAVTSFAFVFSPNHVFERFFRAERSRSRDDGGAGIGLAIVKELIEAHGGQVGAESDNAWTCVWFTLPSPALSLP